MALSACSAFQDQRPSLSEVHMNLALSECFYQKLPNAIVKMPYSTLTFKPSKPKRMPLYKEFTSEKLSRAQNSIYFYILYEA